MEKKTNQNQTLLLDLVKKSKEFLSSLKYQKIKNGETLAYRHLKCSSKNVQKVIVLIHGSITASDTYDTLSVVLQPYFNVYAVDLRMLGDSSYNTPISRVEDWADDLKLFFDSLGIKKFTLAGLSMGGAIAQAFASRYPEYMENLICLGSVSSQGFPIYKLDEQGNNTQKQVENLEEFAKVPSWQPLVSAIKEKNYQAVIGFFDMLFYGNNMKPEPQERYINLAKSATKQKDLALALFLLNKFNLTNKKNQFGNGNGEIDKINCPVLVLHGQKDMIIPVSMAEEIVKSIGENAQLKLIENGGHVFFLESYDYLIQTKDIILNFCKINKK